MVAKESASIDYHLAELAIVRDPADPRRSVPKPESGEHRVLDIGCGIGQTLLAPELQQFVRRCGVDLDGEAIRYGVAHFPELELMEAPAEHLPYGNEQFDLVISRVALPYTDIPQALRQIRRVLRPGGRLWAVLHPAGMEWRRLGQSLRAGAWWTLVDSAYVWANSLLFASIGKTFARPWSGTRESVQTTGGVHRALVRSGFNHIQVTPLGRVFIVEAR